ncbi:MAG: transglycosylase SLT domain-containing protein [Gemmatimonas sp.]
MALALLAVVAVGTPAAAAPQPAKTRAAAAQSCDEAIAWAERLTRMPERLLASVALAESGRWDPVNRAKIAWPWTVTSGGQGRFFSTKQEAIAWVRTLRARGVRNIDVGCMQVNLMHHPEAFVDLDEAFDPATNVAYAAAFLMSLFQEKRSWPVAVGLYHSATPAFHFAYRNKVQTIWNDERRRIAEEKRRATLAAYEERRARLIAEAEARRAGQARPSAVN